jgi:hypothetical protein
VEELMSRKGGNGTWEKMAGKFPEKLLTGRGKYSSKEY